MKKYTALVVGLAFLVGSCGAKLDRIELNINFATEESAKTVFLDAAVRMKDEGKLSDSDAIWGLVEIKGFPRIFLLEGDLVNGVSVSEVPKECQRNKNGVHGLATFKITAPDGTQVRFMYCHTCGEEVTEVIRSEKDSSSPVRRR